MSQRNINQREEIQQPEESQQGEVRTYDRWQLFYLDRLHRLLRLSQGPYSASDEEENRILRRAIFATLLDCELAGVGEEAKKVIAVEE